MGTIELLAPAGNLQLGVAAINCGADAVYMGGPRFGARVAASNSLADIRELAHHAHRFHARIYVTLNTLLKDEELSEAEKLIHELWHAGVDALIIQDMGILEMDLPPIPLFASTQCHIASPEKAVFLEKAGLRRLILARELSLSQIRAIRSETSVELESFVHGALCVSYSGQCYMSYAAGGRSGNRGDCAQPCRLPYSLLDESGNLLVRDRYLLSLKDLNLSTSIGDMLDSGITSFKIEGRLKDEFYIRNVVSEYRRLLDTAIQERGLKKASSGHSYVDFIPDPAKSFNRGFTRLYLNGKPDAPESPFTQKSIGEGLGRVAKVESRYFMLERPVNLHSGDGICFLNENGKLAGMSIEHVEAGKIFPANISLIRKGMNVYRNLDREFEKRVTGDKPRRLLDVGMVFRQEETGFSLTACDEDGVISVVHEKQSFEAAQNPERALATIGKQLKKAGDTVFRVIRVDIEWDRPLFIPVKVLNQARRSLLDNLVTARITAYHRVESHTEPDDFPYPDQELSFEGNVLNRKADAFYRRHGVQSIEPAAESGTDLRGRRVMTSRHCIRRIVGLCSRFPMENPIPLSCPPEGPLFLENDKHRYRLEFDCDRCEMSVFFLS